MIKVKYKKKYLFNILKIFKMSEQKLVKFSVKLDLIKFSFNSCKNPEQQPD